MRPGPERLPADSCPDGVVVHVYDMAGVLIAVSFLARGDDVENAAQDNADTVNRLLAAGAGCVLVAFDGDTGVRWSPLDWLSVISE